MGPTISNMPDISWEYVKKEKSADMIHVLQFPYNGEPPGVSIIQYPRMGLLNLTDDCVETTGRGTRIFNHHSNLQLISLDRDHKQPRLLRP
jgi:hypothetical protein